MSIANWLNSTLLNDQDELADLRGRIVRPVSLLAAAMLAALAVNNFRQGRLLIGVIVLLVVATLLLNVRVMRPGMKPMVPYALVLLPAVAGMLFAISSYWEHIYRPVDDSEEAR